MLKRLLLKFLAAGAMFALIMHAGVWLVPQNKAFFAKQVYADSAGGGNLTGQSADKAWFEQKGLTEATQKSFKMKTMMADPKTGKEVREVELPVTFELEEERASSKKGYKEVAATFTMDTNVTEGKYVCLGWYSAFDSYSGISFESAGKGVFDITMECKWSTISYPMQSVTIVVTCPEGYDQTIFYCGYENLAMHTAWKKLDMEKNSYTIDELPYFADKGKGYYFFGAIEADKRGYTDKGESSKAGEVARPVKGEITAFQSTDRGYLTVTCKEITKDCDGYQVQVSTTKDFAKKQEKNTNLNEMTFVKVEPGTTYYARARCYNVEKGVMYPGKWSKIESVKTIAADKIKKPHKKKDVNKNGTYDAKLFAYAEEWIDTWHKQLTAKMSVPEDQATIKACDKKFGELYLAVEGKYPKLHAEGVGNKHTPNGTLYWAIIQYNEEPLDEIFYEYY